MNTLPTAAGLAMFLPVPPNTILTMIMANAEPIAASYQLTAGGRMSASIRPVTTEVKSNCFINEKNTLRIFAAAALLSAACFALSAACSSSKGRPAFLSAAILPFSSFVSLSAKRRLNPPFAMKK